MSTILDAMKGLATALQTDAYPAFHYVPGDFEPPGYVIQGSDSFITSDDIVFAGERYLHLDVFLAVQLQENDQAVEDLDTLLANLLDQLPDGWGIDQVGAPGPITQGTWTAHAIRVQLSRYITL